MSNDPHNQRFFSYLRGRYPRGTLARDFKIRRDTKSGYRIGESISRVTELIWLFFGY